METSLLSLFKQYIDAFSRYDLNLVERCYLLPCTLNTPERIVVLTSSDKFKQEFNHIFQLLKHENITAFKALNASYLKIKDDLFCVNIDWQFFCNTTLFTEFTAIYHIANTGSQLKIFNVISQDISQSQSLENVLTLNLENE